MKKLKKSFSGNPFGVETMAELASCQCSCTSGYCQCGDISLYSYNYYNTETPYVTDATEVNHDVFGG